MVRECYHLSYQVVNSWCAILIDFISTSNYNESRRNRIVKSNVIKNEEYVLSNLCFLLLVPRK